MDYSDETIESCKRQYIRRAKVKDISREFGVPVRTLYSWIKKGEWKDLAKTDDVYEAINRRIITITNKDDLNDTDLNALDRLYNLREREFKMRAHGSETIIMAGAHKSQKERPLKKENIDKGKVRARKGKRGKNDFTDITPEEVEEKFKEGLFGYQLQAWKKRHKRRRFTLKSRQIGWTFYNAREAFADALMTGDNQAFLSASKAQAQLFKSYITSFALEWFDIEVSGTDKVTLRTDHGDATLYFLSTNSSTAMGPSGHVYVDECFWIKDFKKLNDLAGAIATHSHFRKTYFSTPSTKSHQAYDLWCGDEYRKNQEKRPNLQPFKMPTAAQLKNGHDCIDGMYRQIITIKDAMAGGCGLFDVSQLELENDPETFAQLYMCKFIDDTNSAFLLADLLACGSSDTRWPDFKRSNTRPFGNKPVWIGYDPARTRDSAAICVLAPPETPNGKFRVLEKIILNNQNWAFQADVIKTLTKKYNVEYIGIDTTGPGTGVYERVLEFFPNATAIYYSHEMKTKLVLKAQEIISQKRIEWDEQHTDIPQGFLAIRKTSNGTAIIYKAARDNKKGHADIAWSIMHAIIKEGLKSTGVKKAKVTFGK
jgi:uncharacterized protein YjcR